MRRTDAVAVERKTKRSGAGLTPRLIWIALSSTPDRGLSNTLLHPGKDFLGE